ncbi:MAG TPA: hypothetical protein VHP31_12000, partial [Caproicibacter sp.]|nr:hypothetical protein [Caproicibacter sp.]
MQIYPNTLIANSVSIQSDEYGMRAYVNSVRGRAQLESECTADVVKAVETVWGSTPTVMEPTLPALTLDQTKQNKLA